MLTLLRLLSVILLSLSQSVDNVIDFCTSLFFPYPEMQIRNVDFNDIFSIVMFEVMTLGLLVVAIGIVLWATVFHISIQWV